MAEWGRKEYSKKWPSRTPVWTWMAILGTFVFFAGMLTLEYEQSWTAAERLLCLAKMKNRRFRADVGGGRPDFSGLETLRRMLLLPGDVCSRIYKHAERMGIRAQKWAVSSPAALASWARPRFRNDGADRRAGEAQ